MVVFEIFPEDGDAGLWEEIDEKTLKFIDRATETLLFCPFVDANSKATSSKVVISRRMIRGQEECCPRVLFERRKHP